MRGVRVGCRWVVHMLHGLAEYMRKEYLSISVDSERVIPNFEQ